MHDDIRSGRLVPILTAFRPAGLPLHIVHPRHRLKPRKLRVFEEFLASLAEDFRDRWNIRNPAGPDLSPSE